MQLSRKAMTEVEIVVSEGLRVKKAAHLEAADWSSLLYTILTRSWLIQGEKGVA